MKKSAARPFEIAGDDRRERILACSGKHTLARAFGCLGGYIASNANPVDAVPSLNPARFPVMPSDTHIVPQHVGDPEKCKRACDLRLSE